MYWDHSATLALILCVSQITSAIVLLSQPRKDSRTWALGIGLSICSLGAAVYGVYLAQYPLAPTMEYFIVVALAWQLAAQNATYMTIEDLDKMDFHQIKNQSIHLVGAIILGQLLFRSGLIIGSPIVLFAVIFSFGLCYTHIRYLFRVSALNYSSSAHHNIG